MTAQQREAAQLAKLAAIVTAEASRYPDFALYPRSFESAPHYRAKRPVYLLNWTSAAGTRGGKLARCVAEEPFQRAVMTAYRAVQQVRRRQQ